MGPFLNALGNQIAQGGAGSVHPTLAGYFMNMVRNGHPGNPNAAADSGYHPQAPGMLDQLWGAIQGGRQPQQGQPMAGPMAGHNTPPPIAGMQQPMAQPAAGQMPISVLIQHLFGGQ